MANTKQTYWHCFFLSPLLFLPYRTFAYILQLSILFSGNFCARQGVCLCIYLWFLCFFVRSLFLYYFVLCYSYFFILFLFFLDACLITNERKQEQIWIGVNGEEKKIWKELGAKATIIRMYCMGENLFSIKNGKCKQSVTEKTQK